MPSTLRKFRPVSAAAARFPPETKAAPSSLSTSLTLAAMSLGYGVVQLDVTIVNTSLNSIGTSLGGGVSELQWVVSSYTIAFAAFILTAGVLGDRIGAKRVFMAGFAIFTAASVACALAPNATILIAARAVQGLGAAILVPNSLALLSHAYPDEKQRSRAVGIWAAGASLALTAGPLVGGGLIALVGWRSIFLVNLPIGLAGLWLSWRYAGETTQSPQREIDLPGQIAAIAALGCLAGAIIEGGTLGWGNPFGDRGLHRARRCWRSCSSGRNGARRSRCCRCRCSGIGMFALTSLVGLLVNVAFYGLIFVFSLYFQRVNGLSPFATGLAFLPMMGAVLPVNLVAARVAERIGAPATIAAGAALAASGCLALLGIEPGTGYWAIGAQLTIIGAGLGLLVPPLTSTLLGSVEKSRSGIAAGVLNATRQTGSVLGVALFGSLAGQSSAFMAGAHRSLVISAGLLLAAGAAIWRGARADRKRSIAEIPRRV